MIILYETRENKLSLHKSLAKFRSSPQKVSLGKDALKICSKFTVEHPYQSAISIKLLFNFIENTLQHGCSPVNLLHIFRTPFSKNTCEGMLLKISYQQSGYIRNYSHSWLDLSFKNLLKACNPTKARVHHRYQRCC